MIKIFLQGIIDSLSDRPKYKMISANSLSSYGAITKDIVAAGVSSTDSESTVLTFDICSASEGLSIYDTYDALKTDLQVIGSFDISAKQPKYNAVLDCFILTAIVNVDEVFLHSGLKFAPGVMEFQSIRFPIDIKTYERKISRNVKTFVGVNGEPFHVDFGLEAGFVKGEGYFTHSKWYTEYQQLEALASSGGVGVLILPTGDSVNAFLKSLTTSFRRDIRKLRFTFEFAIV
jgi:hypothetical protein